MDRTGAAPPRMRAVVVLPPLRLSPGFIDYPYFTPLSAVQAAGALEEAGLDVSILNGLSGANADLLKVADGFHLGEAPEEFLRRLRLVDADLTIVVASPFLLTPAARSWLLEVVAAARSSRPGWLVLADCYVGGMHYLEVEAEALLASLPGVDLLLRYEAEQALAQLAARLLEGLPLPAGVLDSRSPFSLDDSPRPAWHLLDTESYFAFLERVLLNEHRRPALSAHPARTLPLVTARGCPFGCVFCTSNPGMSSEDRRKYRAVPLRLIARWVRDWVIAFRIERLVVLDELANLHRDRLAALVDLALELGLRLDFPNGLRADLLDEESVTRLARCTSALTVSLESASWRVQQELLGKRLDPESVRRVAAWANSARLPLDVHVLIGVPGETREEIVSTLTMARDLHRDTGALPLLQFATPLPGTELEEICRREGLQGPAPADPYLGFQGRGVITTNDFDPAFLETCREALALSLAPPAPRKLIVNLTYRCNNHCVFCAIGDRPARDADLSRVAEALQRYRAQGFELLDLDGGEPTLRPDLCGIVSIARDLGYRRVTLISNGRTLAYRALADRLVRAGLGEILISLHACDPRTQSDLTAVQESHVQTIRGLRSCLDLLGPERVGVNTTLVATNLAELRPLAALLDDLGVRRWTLQVVTPFGRARASHRPDPSALSAALLELLRQAPSTLRIRVINCPPCLLPGQELSACTDFGKADRDMVFVGADGTNLQHYLATRRHRDLECERCPWGLVCPGHYVFEDETGDPTADQEAGRAL